MPPIPLEKKRPSSSPHRSLPFERRLLLSVLLAGLPGIVLALPLLWVGNYSFDHRIEGTVGVLIAWLCLSFLAKQNSIDSIRVISNVVSAVKSEDFSFRAAQAAGDDALGELALEVNSLAQALEQERLGSVESANLLRKVMAEAGAVILAFSTDGRLRLVNRAGCALLYGNEDQLLNRHADELGVASLLEGPPAEAISWPAYVSQKRWIVRRTTFRQHGIPHRLIVLSEASEFLRAEERLAWQRIIRVLSHEINNSLAPIKTIARTLARMSYLNDLPPSASESVTHGLGVIENRAESLNRFLQNYARLARLPAPSRKMISMPSLVARVVPLETRLPVQVHRGPNIQVCVDPDQMEQVLINLVQNAVDAVFQAGRANVPDAVVISWGVEGTDVVLSVSDKGTGFSNTENLFVPFYTTKQNGSGIGLVLSRQIIESHSGTLTPANRQEEPGCIVQIRLPLSTSFSRDPRIGMLEQPPGK
jgi:two-component system nitrogen regulation sensor histidine kinase NtrY